MLQLNTKVIAKTIILSADNEVLILQRSDSDPKGPGLWDLPGGTVEAGEQFDAASRREVLEETAITLAPHESELIYTESGVFENGNRCWLFFMASCDAPLEVSLSEEHQAYAWVPLEEACAREYFQTQQKALQYLYKQI